MSEANRMTNTEENLQVVSDRIRNAGKNLTIPVRIFQQHATQERRSGYYIENMTMDKYLEFVHRYYGAKGMLNTEPLQHLTCLYNAMTLMISDMHGDLDRQYLLIDQLRNELKQEKQEALNDAMMKLLPPIPQYLPAPAPAPDGAVPAAPVQAAAVPGSMAAIGAAMKDVVREHKEIMAQINRQSTQVQIDEVDLTGEPPVHEQEGMVLDEDPDKPKPKQRGKNVDDEDLDDEDDPDG